MKDTIQQHLTSMSRKITDIGEIDPPDSSELLGLILPLESCILEQGNATSVLVTKAMREYLEQGAGNGSSDLEPILDGITLLRAIQDALKKGREFPYPIDDVMEKLAPAREADSLEEIFLLFQDMEHDDIQAMGKILNILEVLEASAEGKGEATFLTVAKGVKEYITRLILNETTDLDPLHEGLNLLRAVEDSLKKGKEFLFPIDDVMERLIPPPELKETASGDSSQPAPAAPIGVLSEEAEEATLNEIFRLLREIRHDDLQAMGSILNALEVLEAVGVKNGYSTFLTVTRGVKNYIGFLILNETTDLDPLHEGLNLVRAIWQKEKKGKPFEFPIDEVMEKLCPGSGEAPVPGLPEEPRKDPVTPPAEAMEDQTGKAPLGEKTEPPPLLNEEDIQILGDFVLESLENLESIELNLINLEQAPEDKEIINDIFRPFHTIKGVSGFLDLKKINRLSHSTENLLDSAREGKFIIDNEVTDLILASVDRLKQLLLCVENGIATGTSPMGEGVDIDGLIKRIENAETNAKRLGEILVDSGDIHKEELQEALDIQKVSPEKMVGEIIVDNKFTDANRVDSALTEQKKGKKVSDTKVKVDTDKLDSLVNLTGELVIAQSMLRQNSTIFSAADQTLFQNLNQLGQIVSSLQKIAMSMRMVPIKSTFQKMVRLVRDLARGSGKDVSLKMSGEETEIDRNVAEALYEPMVHMIRNSSDHGLELPEERKKSGKTGNGTIQLRAYHKGGSIIIEIEDDGRGLNRERIFEKAVENELIAPDANLTDAEIFSLIMQPGFSTAKEITEVSGRGVGMDVVKQAIESLRGRLDIDSVPGRGSKFTITLPLTLAIIEGMLVRVGEERYIIPTMAIVESFRPREEEYFTVEGKGEMVMVRGNLVPLIRFEHIYNTAGDAIKPWEGLVVVVENKGDQRGLLIDELLGKEEFVIKSLGESLKGLKGLAGGAILGDGRVGLILDISGLFDSTLTA